MSFDQQIPNKNLLNVTRATFVISRLPSTTFFCQKVKLPGVTLPDVRTGNPYNELNFAGSSANYGDLGIIFKVDEDLKNYQEILNWMTGLGFPEDFKQYDDLKKNAKGNAGIRSDASVILLTSSQNANVVVTLRDIFPKDLSGLQFDMTDENATSVEAMAVFSVRDFTMESVSVS